MKLISVYSDFERSCVVLYKLLYERQPHESISHRVMPSFVDHCAFVAGKPYAEWYLVEIDGQPCGAVYLSKQREIGVGILKAHRGKGFGKQAVQELMRAHPEERFLANINPANEASVAMFRGLGFRLIQHTYERWTQ